MAIGVVNYPTYGLSVRLVRFASRLSVGSVEDVKMKTFNVYGGSIVKGRESVLDETFGSLEEAEGYVQRSAFGGSIDLTIYEMDAERERVERSSYAPRVLSRLTTGEYKRS